MDFMVLFSHVPPRGDLFSFEDASSSGIVKQDDPMLICKLFMGLPPRFPFPEI